MSRSTAPSSTSDSRHVNGTAFDGTDKLTRLAWGTLLVLCGALFLDALDVSMMGVALPSIRTSLHMSTSSLQWVVSAYVLGYGGFLLLGGRAADLLGRRRVFLIALAVFIVASLLGGFAHDGTLLIATRFIKGVSAAFTAPAALSIITTTFAEGPARNKALSIFTATGATGLLARPGLRRPADRDRLALGVLPAGSGGARHAGRRAAPRAAGRRRAPRSRLVRPRRGREHDGRDAAARLHARRGADGRLAVGCGRSARSSAVVALFAAFIARERTAAAPLVRLGILRSGSLVRANLGAMSLFGGWVGFQFIVTLYLQQLRGWSALDTGLAIFPAGVLVALVSPRMASLIGRFGVTRLIVAGMVSIAAGYLLFLPIGLHSSYAFAMLPTFLLAGIGFALAFGPLNVAGTSGVASEEQGLAGGLLNTSFQFGGALVLAIVTAVINANVGSGGTPQATLDGFHAALYVSVFAAVLGIVAMTRRSRAAEVVPAFEEIEESLAEAAEAA